MSPFRVVPVEIPGGAGLASVCLHKKLLETKKELSLLPLRSPLFLHLGLNLWLLTCETKVEKLVEEDA